MDRRTWVTAERKVASDTTSCTMRILFEAFLGGDDEILKEIVATLGKLPEPWWGAGNREL